MPSQALPSQALPSQALHIFNDAKSLHRHIFSAPFSTQLLQDHVVGSASTASQVGLQPQSLLEIGRAAALQPANGKPGWKGWKIGA